MEEIWKDYKDLTVRLYFTTFDEKTPTNYMIWIEVPRVVITNIPLHHQEVT